MPVRKVGIKYAVGKSKPIFKSKASAERAQKAIKAKKSGKRTKR